jgi:anthranilate phosphoribosyltransferase
MSANAIQEAIHLLFGGNDLTTEQADAAMTQIMQGEATQSQIGAFLAALRMKGETVAEITGCASAMRRNAVQVRPDIGDSPLLDVVGTGGDGTYKFNISTIAAFVIAGAGVKVAKHGNRSNKRAGSADVWEALGVTLQLSAEQVGLVFLFAPAYHPAMRHAIGPRREIAARTVFNILGPLTNPAPVTHHLVGVYDRNLTAPPMLCMAITRLARGWMS